jgi:TonB family protein
MRTGLGLTVLLLSGALASAQTKQMSGVDIRKPPKPPAAVKGLPYSGEMRTETSGTLIDGTRIQQSYLRSKEYRDSEGRTRRGESIEPETKDAAQIVTIYDPTAMVEYVLEPAAKTAHRFMLKEPPPPRISLGPPEVYLPDDISPALAADATAEYETLEPETIQGLRAEGARRTLTIADTSPLGDRGPRHIVIDTWTAIDLQIIVREHTSSTGGSEMNTEMTNLRMEEQPTSLFQVPADYRIEDELEDFIIARPVRSRASLPRVLSRATAKYTPEALWSGIQGKVLLAATVDKNGKARDVHVVRSLDPGLDQEAIKAVRQWRFSPGQEGGHAVEVDVNVEITFGVN